MNPQTFYVSGRHGLCGIRLNLRYDVGAAYAFLAADKASFATGANIVLDSGFTLRPLVLVSQDEIGNMNL